MSAVESVEVVVSSDAVILTREQAEYVMRVLSNWEGVVQADDVRAAIHEQVQS